MENLKIDTSEKKILMKNKNSEFGMQSSLRTIRKTWCLVDRFCQGRQQISWLNGLDVFYSCFSNYMAQKITDQRVNKQKKTELVQLKEKTEFFDLRGKNFFNKLIFDQQLAVEIFSTRGKKGNIFWKFRR